MKIVAVIMAGGSGTRLWPLSRSSHPKQFLKVNTENTLIQETVLRLKDLGIDSITTICNEEHRFFVAEQLKDINCKSEIILEPVGKNTAPAVALAALLNKEKEDDSLLLILSADHIIKENSIFIDSIKSAIKFAESGKLVTFGTQPNQAYTGFGYIKKGHHVGNGYKVEKFEEKPSSEVAEEFIKSGKYLWNSGIFLVKASKYLSELKKYRPDILEICEASIENKKHDLDFIRIDNNIFEKCPSDSIDYAVMEKTPDSVVILMEAGWSDVGSWKSVWEISKKDDNGNSSSSDVIFQNTTNTYVNSDTFVATIGIHNLVIVSTKDAILIADKESVQDVKLITEKLKLEDRTEHELHREVCRPWGKYDSVDVGDEFQVKRITVNPGAKLSLQKHKYRAEHWIVVSGTAKVTNDDKTYLVKKNESTYIPLGAIHSLENPEEEKLELIEVQSGSYLGEDDIERFEDIYGRT
tara:strand:+ start:4405 stop:5805 length:1401 start_codon:yes stop_codon:yes gene_type:complete